MKEGRNGMKECRTKERKEGRRREGRIGKD